jgi:acetyl esterase/lipase
MALAAALAVAMLGGSTRAQPPGASPDVYPLYPNGPPDLSKDAPPETSEGGRVRNVTVPTLTVFAPPPGLAADVAVIVAPGGGFEHLSMSNEGIAVAKALAARGVTAIVLKYRLAKSAPRASASGRAKPPESAAAPISAADRIEAQNSSPAALRAMADGAAAVAFVRAHAQALHISPQHVGFLGFSAGAVIAMHVALSPDPAARPDFAAAIYGAMPRGAVAPAEAPPLFLAVAADDKLVGPAGSLPIFEAWRAAGRDVELHIFQSGGHGFGLTAQGATSDHWIDDYLWWLEARGLLPRR